ncbi:MAG: VIT1/CCC1 transporter family protein, partial [Candidatus Woesearchaeota archaeon]
ELHLSKSQFGSPLKSSLIVGSSAIVGSLFPLLPFLFLGVKTAIMVSFFMSIVVLFITGVLKAKLTIGKWLRSGIEMAAIGIGAAITGFLIGWLFNLFY